MSEWLTSIIPAVGDHLWQSTVFAVVAALLTVLLKKNQARVRYWIWMAALMKFLVPFSLLVGLGGLLPRPQCAPMTTPTAYAAMDTLSEPFVAESSPVTPIHVASRTEHWIPEAVASLWLCGLIVALAMWWMRWRRVAEIVRKATKVDAGCEVEVLRRLERDAGMRPVRLMLSRSSMEPGMFGVVRPVLLWPEGISARLSDAQMEAILAHELCHVRRRDNVLAMAQMVVETVFWFYPLVWWMGTRMVEERERACDEEVLVQGRSAETYAESILKICEFCLESPLACASGITGADLKRRIVQIMGRHLGKKLSLGKKAILATAGLVAIAGPVSFGVIWMVPLRAQILHATGPLPSFEVATVRPFKGAPPPPPPLPGSGAPVALAPNGDTGGAHLVPVAMVQEKTPQASPYSPDWQTAAGGRMEFDVASIRPNNFGQGGDKQRSNVPLGGEDFYTPTGGLFSTVNTPLMALLTFAYKLTLPQQDALRSSLPDWVFSYGYNVEARTENHEVTKDQLRLMMQSLLAERFKLAIHYETRDVSVFAAVLVKPGTLGPHLQPHPSDAAPCSSISPPKPADGAPASGPITVAGGYPILCGGFVRMQPSEPGRRREGGRNLTMSRLVNSFVGLGNLDRPVVDETGLTGNFDFVIDYLPPPPPSIESESDAAGPTFLEALKDQLGLKLVQRKAPMQFVAVDHVERPLEN